MTLCGHATGLVAIVSDVPRSRPAPGLRDRVGRISLLLVEPEEIPKEIAAEELHDSVPCLSR